MSNLYSKVSKTNLSYFEAYKLMKQGYCLTRPDWQGFHFIIGKDYMILLKDKTVLINPKEKYDIHMNDWMLVVPTKEAVLCLREANILK